MSWLSVWYIQDWQCFGVSISLDGVHGHGHICLCETEEEYKEWLRWVPPHPQVFLSPWLCDQAVHRYRKETALFWLWWWEERVGWGQVCCTLQEAACIHREPYRLWLHWNGQWQKTATSLKALRALSWRQWLMLSGPNQKNMEHILMKLHLIWAKWSQRKASQCNTSIFWEPEVRWWSLKWQSLEGK